MTIRNTKIVATLGPASSSPEKIKQLINAGMDVARINFSHGGRTAHASLIKLVRSCARMLKKPVGILQDLSGPKLRIDSVVSEPMALTSGSSLIITSKKIAGNAQKLSISSLPYLFNVIRKNERIILNDGAVTCTVVKVKKKEIYCRVAAGGEIGSHKGVSLPDTSLHKLPSLTAKDMADLAFGLKHDVDFIALSFVRSSDDIRKLKSLIRKANKNIPVIAKIEKHEALQNLKTIIQESDGVMVARGDLGVETDIETIALKQKEIIHLSNRCGKVVITATQMLESMITRSTPTRAEVSDITNAIFDGTDAVMLSGETAVGAYPVQAVSMMEKIATKTEDSMNFEQFLMAEPIESSESDAVAHAACVLAREIKADAIVVTTLAGSTPRMISHYRPLQPIITVTPNENMLARLNLIWGIYPFLIPFTKNTDQLISYATQAALRSGIVKKGSKIVICSGVTMGKSGSTNLIITKLGSDLDMRQ
ncbi:MAG: pyruvate kinase [bacterium]